MSSKKNDREASMDDDEEAKPSVEDSVAKKSRRDEEAPNDQHHEDQQNNNNEPVDEEEQEESFETLPDELKIRIIDFLAVKSILQSKQVSRSWNNTYCDSALKAKKKPGAGIFREKKELQTAVDKLCKCLDPYDENIAEEVACSYGWPIGKWDVSQITDFSFLFKGKRNFRQCKNFINLGGENVSCYKNEKLQKTKQLNFPALL